MCLEFWKLDWLRKAWHINSYYSVSFSIIIHLSNLHIIIFNKGVAPQYKYIAFASSDTFLSQQFIELISAIIRYDCRTSIVQVIEDPASH